MQRGFALLPILLIVILLIVGGGYLFMSNQKSDSPQNTIFQTKKTTLKDQKENENDKYKNDKLGFEFTIQDKNYQIEDDSESQFNKRTTGDTVAAVSDVRKNFTSYVKFAPPEVKGGVAVVSGKNFDTSPFLVWVFDNPNNLTPENWYKDYWYYPFIWGDYSSSSKNKVAPVTETSVSGQIAKYGVIDYQTGKPEFYYLNYGGRMYLLRVLGEEGKSILSSFKLLGEEAKLTNKDKTDLEVLVAEKNQAAVQDLNITFWNNLDQFQGKFAVGDVGPADGGGGAQWIAAKVNGKWEVVAITQAPISCDLVTKYQLPKAIVGSCVDDSGEVKKL